MGASIDEPAANRCGVRGWGSSFIDRGNFVHSEGFAPLNQCPVARIPDLFALPIFKGFRLLGAVHGYGLLRQTQRQFPALGSVHEKGFALPRIIFIGTVFCQGFTPSLLSACPHPWVQYKVLWCSIKTICRLPAKKLTSFFSSLKNVPCSVMSCISCKETSRPKSPRYTSCK